MRLIGEAGVGGELRQAFTRRLTALPQRELSTPLITGVGEFTVGVGHFVERHGLAVLIVLGESIAEVGVAASGQGHLGTAIAGALLALTLAAAMWWLYFGREQHDSQIWLEHVPSGHRPRAAVYAFGYAYYLIILGIAVAAVGMQKAIDSFGHAAVNLSATLLPLGTTLYLTGLGCFHRTLSGRWPATRLAAALGVAVMVTPAALERRRG